MLSAFYLTFRRANLSLMGCTSAEPISVSVRSKVQRIKLYLQTVEIPNHFHFQRPFKAIFGPVFSGGLAHGVLTTFYLGCCIAIKRVTLEREMGLKWGC
jgi:hypothetical protein